MPAHLVNAAEEIDETWLQGVECVGVTSGASTPEWLVEAVVRRLQPLQVRSVKGMEENVSFVLPKELRGVASTARSPAKAPLSR